MSQFLEQSKLFDQVIRLDEQERIEPMAVINHFFDNYRLHEWRHYLWTMVEAGLTTDSVAFSDPQERADLLLHYEDLEKLLEAVCLLWQRHDAVSSTGEES